MEDGDTSHRRHDRKLAKALRKGSVRAWREFYALYATPVYRFVLSRSRDNVETATDLARETLVIAVERIGDFDWRKGDMWAWLCGIAMNKLRETARSKTRRDRIAMGMGERAANLATDASTESALDVEYVLSTLRPDWQDVLEQKYILGKSVREIAEALNTSEKAVESRLTRAREAFRQAYGARPNAAEGSTS